MRLHDFRSAAFWPNGKWLVSAGVDGLKLWDTRTGLKLRTLNDGKPLGSLVLSPDGKLIAVVAGDGIQIWNTDTGTELRNIGRKQDDLVACLAMHGRRLVVGTWNGSLAVWNVDTGVATVSLKENGSEKRVHFDENGEFSSYNGAGPNVQEVAFSQDGTRIVSGGNGELELWNAETGKKIRSLAGNAFCGLAISPDGKRIVSGSYGRTLKVWDVESCDEVFTLKGGSEASTRTLSFSPDGRRIVGGGRRLTLWDANTAEKLFELKMDNEIRGLVISPNGKQMLGCGFRQSHKLWDAKGRQDVFVLDHPGVVKSAAFSPDGKRIVSGSWGAATRAESGMRRRAKRCLN